MKRTGFNVVDYDPKDYPNKIDYSEKITEPGLVLSMREIYQRYAAEGVDLLKGELVEDDEEPEMTHFFEHDDDLDVLQHVSEVRRRQASAEHSAKRAKKASKKEAEETQATQQEQQAQQSGAQQSQQVE